MQAFFTDNVFAPLVATVITTVVVASREWVRGRQKEAQGRRNLDLATKKLEYFEAWFTLYERINDGQPVGGLRALVEPELQAARQLAERGWDDAQRSPRWTFREIWTYVLLTDARGTFSVRLLKLSYWISLLYLIFLAPILVSAASSPTTRSLDTQQPLGLGTRIIASLLLFLVFGMGPVVILRALTQWRGRVASQRSPTPSTRPLPHTDAETGSSSPPAGWYSDPQAPAVRRYWDGANWTTHTAS
jgi:hypothetical protein